MAWSTAETRADERCRQLKMRTVPQDASRYLKAHSFLTDLRKKYMTGRITSTQYIDIRNIAIKQGDLNGATKVLGVALMENCDRGDRV